MRRQLTTGNRWTQHLRPAFTLVEMLVAVALVMLMMSLFAEVFSLATSTMSRQKGLAENDQRARMVASLLGTDFRKRTFRDVVPFLPGMDQRYFPTPNSDRSGYLSYSENLPEDDTDDVLRLTIDAGRYREDMGPMSPNPQDMARDDFFLYGRATQIGNNLLANPNQPEGDDGVLGTANGVGQSRFAEVVWFLRGGNLYRRMMLIRQPYRTDLPSNVQSDPTTQNPPSAIRSISTGYTSFWHDFDYSAYFNSALGCVQFHGPESLNNLPSLGANPYNVGTLGIVPVSLGIPVFRFGYSPTTTTLAPREYDISTPATRVFFGCFTHGETCQANFRSPGLAVTVGTDDPYTRAITLDTATNSVTPFGEGDRVGEDLLLSNVVSFDIKIWDPGVGDGPDDEPGFRLIDDDNDGTTDNDSERGSGYPWGNTGLRGAISDDGSFVDLGHDTNTGYYFRPPVNGIDGNGTNTNYGNRFDTWHPFAGLPSDPPYFPARYVLDGSQMSTNRPTGRRKQAWQANFAYTAGDIIFPTPANMIAQGMRFAYRCVADGVSGVVEPNWTAADFKLTTESVTGGATWQAIPNLVPVRALQIKIRYLDVSSGLLKDLTLVESLRDDL